MISRCLTDDGLVHPNDKAPGKISNNFTTSQNENRFYFYFNQNDLGECRVQQMERAAGP